MMIEALWKDLADSMLAEDVRPSSEDRSVEFTLPEGVLYLEYTGEERGLRVFEYSFLGESGEKSGRVVAGNQQDLVRQLRRKRKVGFAEEKTLRLERLLRSLRNG